MELLDALSREIQFFGRLDLVGRARRQSTAFGIGSGFRRIGEYATSSLPFTEIEARRSCSSIPAGTAISFV